MNDSARNIDWWGVDQSLLKNFPGLTPAAIDQLTLSEIALMLDPPGPRPHGGLGYEQDDVDIDEAWHKWKHATPKEKIERIRQLRGF